MEWITIHTVTYPSEAHVLKMQLEVEGITVFLKDELTIQTDNFMSNAIGGVKIQVEEGQVEVAVSVLKSLGYIKEKNKNERTFLDSIYGQTAKIPWIKNMIPEMQLLFLVGLVLLVVLVPYFFLKP